MGLFTAAALVFGVAATGPPVVDVCWDYGCSERASVMLPEEGWDRIRARLYPEPPDADTERARIADAIAEFERVVGPLTGTDANLGGNLAGSGKEGQMDCLDESHNTSVYLQLLADHDLLRWHEPGEPERRAPWIFNVHWSAVVIEKDTEQAWVVDSWFRDNGSRPFVEQLEDWRRGAGPE